MKYWVNTWATEYLVCTRTLKQDKFFVGKRNWILKLSYIQYRPFSAHELWVCVSLLRYTTSKSMCVQCALKSTISWYHSLTHRHPTWITHIYIFPYWIGINYFTPWCPVQHTDGAIILTLLDIWFVLSTRVAMSCIGHMVPCHLREYKKEYNLIIGKMLCDKRASFISSKFHG